MEQTGQQPSYQELAAENQLLKTQLANLTTQLINLQKQIFGSKSEKFADVATNQVPLFDEMVMIDEGDNTKISVPAHEREKRSRKAVSKDVERERTEYEPHDLNCSCCGEELSKIGEEITEQIELVKAKVVIQEHVKIKRACSACKQGVATGKLPDGVPVIEGSKAGASLLSHIIVSKYCDHLPLHRQEQILARFGVDIPRQRMSDWIGILSQRYLIPIAKSLKRQILTNSYIYADETTIKVQQKEKDGLKTGYFWGLLSKENDVYFEYDPSRSSAVASHLLDGFEGFVHTDAYAGYNPVFLPDSVTRVGCFAHVRRKFIELQKIVPKETGIILKSIAALYAIEKQAKKLNPEQIAQLRARKAVPILERLKANLEAIALSTLPQHKLTKACSYALNQWQALCVYTTDGNLSIDNNPIERQIRPIAVGRHNWLFAGSHDGARASAALFSLINTCKLNKINPCDYFNDILTKVSYHPNSDIWSLTPRGWRDSLIQK